MTKEQAIREIRASKNKCIGLADDALDGGSAQYSLPQMCVYVFINLFPNGGARLFDSVKQEIADQLFTKHGEAKKTKRGIYELYSVPAVAGELEVYFDYCGETVQYVMWRDDGLCELVEKDSGLIVPVDTKMLLSQSKYGKKYRGVRLTWEESVEYARECM